MKTNQKKLPEYQTWLINHDCHTHHSGSSGLKQPTGIVKIFSRSIPQNKLQYTIYIGECVSSAFSANKEPKPYGVEHAVTFKPEMKELSDGRGNKRAGRQTDKTIKVPVK